MLGCKPSDDAPVVLVSNDGPLGFLLLFASEKDWKFIGQKLGP